MRPLVFLLAASYLLSAKCSSNCYHGGNHRTNFFKPLRALLGAFLLAFCVLILFLVLLKPQAPKPPQPEPVPPVPQPSPAPRVSRASVRRPRRHSKSHRRQTPMGDRQIWDQASPARPRYIDLVAPRRTKIMPVIPYPTYRLLDFAARVGLQTVCTGDWMQNLKSYLELREIRLLPQRKFCVAQDGNYMHDLFGFFRNYENDAYRQSEFFNTPLLAFVTQLRGIIFGDPDETRISVNELCQQNQDGSFFKVHALILFMDRRACLTGWLFDIPVAKSRYDLQPCYSCRDINWSASRDSGLRLVSRMDVCGPFWAAENSLLNRIRAHNGTSIPLLQRFASLEYVRLYQLTPMTPIPQRHHDSFPDILPILPFIG